MKYKCTKDFVMEDGSINFKKGKTYEFEYLDKSSQYPYFTPKDEGGCGHRMGEDDMKEYFESLINQTNEI